MIRYMHAPKNKVFALTEFGFEHAHVRCKYEADSVHKMRYMHKVPLTWFEKGYVQLIWEGGCNEG